MLWMHAAAQEAVSHEVRSLKAAATAPEKVRGLADLLLSTMQGLQAQSQALAERLAEQDASLCVFPILPSPIDQACPSPSHSRVL